MNNKEESLEEFVKKHGDSLEAIAGAFKSENGEPEIVKIKKTPFGKRLKIALFSLLSTAAYWSVPQLGLDWADRILFAWAVFTLILCFVIYGLIVIADIGQGKKPRIERIAWLKSQQELSFKSPNLFIPRWLGMSISVATIFYLIGVGYIWTGILMTVSFLTTILFLTFMTGAFEGSKESLNVIVEDE
jgi:hypothetical protein